MHVFFCSSILHLLLSFALFPSVTFCSLYWYFSLFEVIFLIFADSINLSGFTLALFQWNTDALLLYSSILSPLFKKVLILLYILSIYERNPMVHYCYLLYIVLSFKEAEVRKDMKYICVVCYINHVYHFWFFSCFCRFESPPNVTSLFQYSLSPSSVLSLPNMFLYLTWTKIHYIVYTVVLEIS